MWTGPCLPTSPGLGCFQDPPQTMTLKETHFRPPGSRPAGDRPQATPPSEQSHDAREHFADGGILCTSRMDTSQVSDLTHPLWIPLTSVLIRAHDFKRLGEEGGRQPQR